MAAFEYRVKALSYRIVSDLEHYRFDDASPLTVSFGQFDCPLRCYP